MHGGEKKKEMKKKKKKRIKKAEKDPGILQHIPGLMVELQNVTEYTSSSGMYVYVL